jgi:hypothetical protein
VPYSTIRDPICRSRGVPHQYLVLGFIVTYFLCVDQDTPHDGVVYVAHRTTLGLGGASERPVMLLARLEFDLTSLDLVDRG